MSFASSKGYIPVNYDPDEGSFSPRYSSAPKLPTSPRRSLHADPVTLAGPGSYNSAPANERHSYRATIGQSPRGDLHGHGRTKTPGPGAYKATLEKSHSFHTTIGNSPRKGPFEHEPTPGPAAYRSVERERHISGGTIGRAGRTDVWTPNASPRRAVSDVGPGSYRNTDVKNQSFHTTIGTSARKGPFEHQSTPGPAAYHTERASSARVSGGVIASSGRKDLFGAGTKPPVGPGAYKTENALRHKSFCATIGTSRRDTNWACGGHTSPGPGSTEASRVSLEKHSSSCVIPKSGRSELWANGSNASARRNGASYHVSESQSARDKYSYHATIGTTRRDCAIGNVSAAPGPASYRVESAVSASSTGRRAKGGVISTSKRGDVFGIVATPGPGAYKPKYAAQSK